MDRGAAREALSATITTAAAHGRDCPSAIETFSRSLSVIDGSELEDTAGIAPRGDGPEACAVPEELFDIGSVAMPDRRRVHLFDGSKSLHAHVSPRRPD
jgi:hypothetical protein